MTDREIIDAVNNKVQKKKDVAKEIGVDYIYLSKILNGAIPVGKSVLRRMETWLNK